MTATTRTIPRIDVRRLGGAAAARPAVGASLCDALHRIGFCYVVGHGIPAAVEADAFAAARAFFALDAQTKARLSIANSPHFRGYTPLGGEWTRGRRDWREQLDLGLDEPTETIAPDDPPWKRLRGPNQWPAELPALRPAVTAWTDRMQSLSVDVLRALAVGLGRPADCFDDAMLPRGDPHLKLIRYAGAQAQDTSGTGGSDAADATDDQGVGWHHDSGVLTFVLQDAVGGLEVRTDAGVVTADPVPGAYLVNVGEMLQRATAGYLRATPHRVVRPRPGEERISLAWFAHPRYESRFEAIPMSSAPTGADRHRAADAGGDPIHACFGDNYLKIRLRSHPDVAERFYADVLNRTA